MDPEMHARLVNALIENTQAVRELRSVVETMASTQTHTLALLLRLEAKLDAVPAE